MRSRRSRSASERQSRDPWSASSCSVAGVRQAGNAGRAQGLAARLRTCAARRTSRARRASGRRPRAAKSYRRTRSCSAAAEPLGSPAEEGRRVATAPEAASPRTAAAACQARRESLRGGRVKRDHAASEAKAKERSTQADTCCGCAHLEACVCAAADKTADLAAADTAVVPTSRPRPAARARRVCSAHAGFTASRLRGSCARGATRPRTERAGSAVGPSDATPIRRKEAPPDAGGGAACISVVRYSCTRHSRVRALFAVAHVHCSARCTLWRMRPHMAASQPH